MRFTRALTIAALAAQAACLTIGGKQMKVERGSDGLQDIVTYDEHSLMVYGERIFVFSGEFHPYRLPVPDLWLDVFQKVKALGFSAVSFYVDWALLEGHPGQYTAKGIFDFEPFYEAATKAGIYLIARPGPYINAESSGGGFPGWLTRISGELRTRAPDYLNATNNYMAHIGASIAGAQITKGGPIILVQPENEYTDSAGNPTGGFPDPIYFHYVEQQLRNAGVVVPLISNDACACGIFAPGTVWNGTTIADVDIYGHDSYPLGFDCANPFTWPAGDLPTSFHATHEVQSPSTFYSLDEFQGGSFDPWGGLGFAQCSILLNNEFERVFYKNDFAAGAALLNIYMIFGGTNWGNLGHPGGYTSYDYGASITENRELYREKYSELKLEANFIRVSPTYLTASVGPTVNGTYADTTAITTTPLFGNGSATNFYVVRHTDYQQLTSQTYTLTLNTSQGVINIPQLGGSLTLSGRDSKIHVTDYDIGGSTLLYSTAEIFTWKKFENNSVVVVYGGPGEQHELAVISSSPATQIEGSGVTTKSTNSSTILNWQTSTTRQVVQVGDVLVYILDRNSAYNYWVPDFVRDDQWGAFTSNIENRTSVIVGAGYLIRSASINGSTLNIEGDLNATVPFNVIGAPAGTTALTFNGQTVDFTTDATTGELTSQLEFSAPELNIPDLSQLDWKYLDDLPEIQSTYDDSKWTLADHTTTVNPRKLTTPTSLYASDYGYNTGVLLYRGKFVANGDESTFAVETQGGFAFGSSVWINSTYIGSWAGIDKAEGNNSTYTLPNLSAGKTYILTVVVDHQGLDESYDVGPFSAGGDQLKNPRGILDYSLSGHAQSDVTWKLTGNLGGENYVDKVRGPLNEGGLFAERQGFTQPNPPSSNWASSSPETGITSAGIAFYSSNFTLDFPENHDIPIFFNFGNSTVNGTTSLYRAQLWVNGYQFGKYVNNVGPQSSFPVPQGILNFQGSNSLAIELWAQQASGAALTNFTMVTGVVASTGMKAPATVDAPAYKPRPEAY